jgi:hypothetical protein
VKRVSCKKTRCKATQEEKKVERESFELPHMKSLLA